jgi:hypothetical protein
MNVMETGMEERKEEGGHEKKKRAQIQNRSDKDGENDRNNDNKYE